MSFKRTDFLVSASGGTIAYSVEGEVLFAVAVPPGRVPAAEYFDMIPGDGNGEAHLSEGLVALAPRSIGGIQPYGPGSHETGANPDFQPTSATRFEREMRVMVAKLQADTSRVAARQRALDAVERVPQAPAPVVAAVDEVKLVE